MCVLVDMTKSATTTKATVEIKDRCHIAKKVAQKELELRQSEDKILALNDVIKHKTHFLREKNAHEKAIRVAKSRFKTHMDYYNADLRRRPPDRSDDIRMYTKMDLDVWAYPQVREFFNKYADPTFDNSYKLTPSQSGYMIKISNSEK